MRKYNYWDINLLFNECFFAAINLTSHVLWHIYKKWRLRPYLTLNKHFKNNFNKDRCIIVGNSPSIKKQDLSYLIGEKTFFVNRAFLHPQYEKIQPTFHVFIDPKLGSGEWPITFLDTIIEKNPNVTLILHIKWATMKKFQKYKKIVPIIWIYPHLFFTSFFNSNIKLNAMIPIGNVVKTSVFCASYFGFEKIILLGAEANGVCYNLIEQDSHFYGNNQEDLEKNMQTIIQSLYSMSWGIRQWNHINNYYKKRNTILINATEGGILNMIDRKKFPNVLHD